MTIETQVEPVEGLAERPCGMCFGTGKTPRYRGPDRSGPCMACAHAKGQN